MQNWIDSWPENYKIIINACGCGFKFADILKIPGASKMIAGLFFPYSEDVIEIYAGISKNFVSQESAKNLVKNNFFANDGYINDKLIQIGISGAITTNRYRRGNNLAHVYISSVKNYNFVEKSFVIELEKPSEETYNLLALNPPLLQSAREHDDGFICNRVMEEVLAFIKEKDDN